HAGLSTIDFTTRLTHDLPEGSLQDLPWDIWLDTLVNQDVGRCISNPTNEFELDWMSVKLTNPGKDFLQESRTFGTIENTRGDLQFIIAQQWYPQSIITEQLNLNGIVYDYAHDIDNDQTYWVDPNYNQNGNTSFAYMSAGDPLLTAEFYVVGDATNANNTGVTGGYDGTISDIWDALAVNQMGGPHIGNNNLEMVFRDGDGAEIFDVVYIPMSHMLWKK
ncbi:MAG: hypothetical protein KAJ45_08885, partial [Desulfobulbaceae bacterium]|nr:hypothetical protein [Desulfobulbaceae bacterium]